MSRWVFLIFVLATSTGVAFPDVVRHGYSSCMTCHFNPSGGGLLNSYGKFVAGELFGTWNSSDDALPWLVKAVEDPRFSAGIFARGVQVYQETETYRRGDFKKMQLDLELGWIRGPLYGFVTTGLRGSAARSDQKETDFFVRSAYITHANRDHAYRIGKFFPEYGIRLPNHNGPTRKGLYWDQGDEPFVAQVSLFTTTWDYNLAYVVGADNTSLAKKKGVTGSFIYKAGNSRSGVSLLRMEESAQKTASQSVFTQVGFLGKGYVLAELAMKENQSQGLSKERSQHTFLEAGWEIRKGVIPYIGYQSFALQGANQNTSTTPLGLRFYPLTHSEMVLEYQPLRIQNDAGTSSATLAFAMFNVYF